MKALRTVGARHSRWRGHRVLPTLLAVGLVMAALVVALPSSASATHQNYCGHGTGPWFTRVDDPFTVYELRHVFKLHANYYAHWHLYREQKRTCFFWVCHVSTHRENVWRICG